MGRLQRPNHRHDQIVRDKRVNRRRREIGSVRGAFVEHVEHELLTADTTLCVRLVDSQLGCVLQRRAQIRSGAGQR